MYDEDEHHHDGHDDPDFDYTDDERAAYDEDRAAQDAVDDLKYDAMTPEQDEPPEGYYDRPTHGELAEELAVRATNAHGDPCDDDVTRKVANTIAVAQLHATLAVADELAQLRAVLTPTPESPGSVGEGSKSPADPAALAEWLQCLSFGSIVRDRYHHAWERSTGCSSVPGSNVPRTFPTLIYGLAGRAFELTDGHGDLGDVAGYAPFTVVDPGGAVLMAEPPADIVRRAAAVVRERAELGADVVERERQFLSALAESWDHVGDDMDDCNAHEVPMARGRVVRDERGALHHDWTATLKAARAYVGDETPT